MNKIHIKSLLQEKLNLGKYIEAMSIWEEYEEITQYEEQLNEYLDDETYIYAANIYENIGEGNKLFKVLSKGLKINPYNPELYLMLGNYYLNFKNNPKQAYLCYENGLFYSRDDEDRECLYNFINVLIEKYGINLPKTAIIILSYNLLDYTRQCVESIRKNTPETSREIIVVDNASTDESVAWLKQQKDIKLVLNDVNKGFPAACNQGIRIAESCSDIFLLNNDTILCDNALFWLRMGLYENSRIGAAGSVSNCVSNAQMIRKDWANVSEVLNYAIHNNVPQEHCYEEKTYLVGFALLLRRDVLEKVGYLDEGFGIGNSEDCDIGLRMLKCGYKNILCHNSFIFHFGSKSFGKLGAEYAKTLNKNSERLNNKWDFNCNEVMYPDYDLIAELDIPEETPVNILDIGCGIGAEMIKIKYEYPQASVYGIERSNTMAELASESGNVLCGNVQDMMITYPKNFFDFCIIKNMADELYDLDILLGRIGEYLKAGGMVIFSVHNIKYWGIMYSFIKNEHIDMTAVAVSDFSHLKMLTKGDIIKILKHNGYSIKKIKGIAKDNVPMEYRDFVANLAAIAGQENVSDYIPYKYIFSVTIN